MKDLNKKEIESLYQVTKNTIKKMTYGGGRDTEKDIYGNNGGYVTILSSKTYKKEVCPNCQSTFKKESFLGGSIYFCPSCQLSEYKC